LIKLFVNIDHVATVREARKTYHPDPLEVALLAEKAGAFGITAHLREDRRHIQDKDIQLLKNNINTPFNLELAAIDEMLDIALEIKPFQVSLVPEKRMEITTEGGLNVCADEGNLLIIGRKLKNKGILFSLFIDPLTEQVNAAHRVEANSVEFNTGTYSESNDTVDIKKHLLALERMSKYAGSLGLRVFAGHGLTKNNVQDIAAIPEIEELNIGHYIVSRSICIGIEPTIKEMLASIQIGFNSRL
jgi:pyridoxine 5-phosphate synthase